MSAWARIETDFGRVIGRIGPPEVPTDEGLDVTDCTGVLIGNADIEGSSVYEPPGEPERVPQGYPTQGDMP